jgi:hypothetical protein
MQRLGKERDELIECHNVQFDASILPAPPEGYYWSSGTEQEIVKASHWWYLMYPDNHPNRTNEGRALWVTMAGWGKLCAGLVEAEIGFELEPEEYQSFVFVLLARERVLAEEAP